MTVRINLGPYNALEKDTFFLIESQKTRPNGRSSSSEVNIEPLKITDIPAAMRKMGWSKSAALMTRWLKSPAWKCPEAWKSGQTLPKGLYLPDEHCDDMTIKMSWLMQYPYAKKSAEELIRKRAFSPAGLRMIADRLKLLGWDGMGKIHTSLEDAIFLIAQACQQENWSNIIKTITLRSEIMPSPTYCLIRLTMYSAHLVRTT